MSESTLDKRSLQLRRKLVDAVAKGRRGHVGAALSIIDILRVLYDDILNYDPKEPQSETRDRFILSKGHACLALYVLLADKGFFPKEELSRCTLPGSILGGHPEYGKIPGVEASTGSLGHGLPIAVGMALNARIEKANYGIFALISDGECNEGSTWEAALTASKHKLSNLTVIVDYNQMQCHASTHEVLELEPFADKWKSFGFEVREVDGHNVEILRNQLTKTPFHHQKPGLLLCHTVKGKGIPFLENNAAWHHKSKISDDEIKEMHASLGGIS